MDPDGEAALARRGVEACLHALRTGEGQAAAHAGRFLAEHVRFVAGQQEIEGRAAVVARLAGQWPMTAALARGNWQIAEEEGGRLVARGDFAHVGAAPAEFSLHFQPDGDGRIASIEQRMTRKASVPIAAMTPVIRRRIDRALADGNPITVGYADAGGRAILSLRGSIRTYDDRTLSLWARNAEGGLVAAVRDGRPISMLYREPSTRTTMIVGAIGRLVEDEAERDWIYAMLPEVEQTHDVERRGAALLFTVRTITGLAPEGTIDLRAE